MFPNQLACKKKMLSRLRKCWEVEGEIVYSWNSQNSTKQLNCPIMEKLWYFVIICIEKKYGVLLLEYVQKIRGLFLFPVFFILEINLYMCKYGLANFWKVFYNSYVFFFFSLTEILLIAALTIQICHWDQQKSNDKVFSYGEQTRPNEAL